MYKGSLVSLIAAVVLSGQSALAHEAPSNVKPCDAELERDFLAMNTTVINETKIQSELFGSLVGINPDEAQAASVLQKSRESVGRVKQAYMHYQTIHPGKDVCAMNSDPGSTIDPRDVVRSLRMVSEFERSF